MADNATGQAQNKLGQLFVDIGVGGLGQTLKALNSVSATFLLTKTAATQAIKPFVEMGKQATNNAVSIAKMGAALGTTLVDAQKLTWYLRQNNLSESLAGDLGSLSQMFTRIRKSRSGLNEQMSITMGELGLDWQNYDGSAESMFQFVKDVQQKIKERNIPANLAKMYLQDLGLGNSEWFYALQKGDFDLSKSKAIKDSDMQALIEAKEKANETAMNLEMAKARAVSKGLDKGGATLQDKILNIASDINDALSDDEKEAKAARGRLWERAIKGAYYSSPVYGALGLYGLATGTNTYLPDIMPSNNLSPLEDIKDLAPDSVGGKEVAALTPPPNIENKTEIRLTNKISGNNVKFEEFTAEEENALTGGKRIEVTAETIDEASI